MFTEKEKRQYCPIEISIKYSNVINVLYGSYGDDGNTDIGWGDENVIPLG